MLGLIIIALFAGFLGIFTYDFFTKKKTEVNGAHVVVGFPVAGKPFSCIYTDIQSWLPARVTLGSADYHKLLIAYLCSRSLEDQVVLERHWRLNSQTVGPT